MKRAGTIVALAACLTALAGCANAPAAPAVHGLWYLQTPDSSDRPNIYVAIVNRSNQDRQVKELALNAFSDAADAGWRLKFDPPLVLPAGRMLVQNAARFERSRPGSGRETWPDRCQVPVEIRVFLEPAESVPVSTASLMPSVLPNNWEECPGAR